MRKIVIVVWTLLFFIPLFSASAGDIPDNISDELRAEIRAIQEKIKKEGLTWEAGYNEIMEMTLEERHQLLGYRVPDEVKSIYKDLNKLPPPLLTNTEDCFDWRVLGGVTPVQNQGSCGSCWAFGATGAFESAYLLAEGVVPDFAEQVLVSCDENSNGCEGGWDGSAYNFFSLYGAFDESCMPYQANDSIPCDIDDCDVVAYQDGYMHVANNVNAIKNTVVITPISTSFTVYDDFNSYQSGCYEHVGTEPTNHCVVIVGWDDNECNGDGAWIVKNSWGEGWGRLGGYFYIKYGSASIGSNSNMPLYNISGLPELEYTPDSIYVELGPDWQTTRTVELSNIGDGALRYYIDGYTVTDQDSFGYYWRDSDNPDGPDYNWIDITSDGDVVNFSGYDDNGNSGQLDLGFDFNYYENTYDKFTICVNGWISFNSSYIMQWENEIIPSYAQPNNMVAAFYDDLNMEYGGNIYYYTNETDTAIITWDQIPDSRQEGIFTFQVILAAPNTIICQYNTMGPGRLNECSIGIENRLATVGTQVAYNEDYVHNDLAVEFMLGDAVPPFTWVAPNPQQGTVPPFSQQDIELNFNALNLPPGTYNGMITIMTNSIENPVASIPVTLNTSFTNIEGEELATPDRFALHPVFPNPFNADAKINYCLPQAGDITLEIFNLLGQRVATLYDGYQIAGEHSLTWKADGQSSGIYMVKLASGQQSRTAKVTLLK
ncbi:MAG: T9SS type A sorting domain-containing protein [candidate division Zixibacteria bacterium]|nr:T9SS type A sorting domain-containing protein [candidate division Zixibacteria bacterium]